MLAKAFNLILNSKGLGLTFFSVFICSLLILPLPAVYGYGVQVVRYVGAGGTELPPFAWNDFFNYFVDGLRYLLSILLLVAPFLLLPIILLLLMSAGVIKGTAIALLSVVLCLLCFIVGCIVCAYLSPVLFGALADADGGFVIASLKKLRALSQAAPGYMAIGGGSIVLTFIPFIGNSIAQALIALLISAAVGLYYAQFAISIDPLAEKEAMDAELFGSDDPLEGPAQS